MMHRKKSKLGKAIVILVSACLLLGLATPAGGAVQAADLTGLTEAELESYYSQAGGPNPLSAGEPAPLQTAAPCTASVFSAQTESEALPSGGSAFFLQTASPQPAGVQAVDTGVEALQVPGNAYLVIDISEWQNPKAIDYDLLCQQIDGVILRIGFTGYGHDKNKVADLHFEQHYAEFKSRGVPVGVYWFSRADTVAEAEVEANMTLDLLEGKELELPIYWDTEDNYYQRLTTRQLLTDVAISYLDTIRQADREAGIYASVNWYLNRLDLNRLWEHQAENFFEVWVAHYNSWAPNQESDIYGLYSPQFEHNYWMWQFTSTGRLNGYNGSLDFNFRAKNGPDRIVRIDQTAPEIKGAPDVSLLQGLDFDLLAGVRAWDDRDGTVVFSVRPKTVSTKLAGTYVVEYTAVDAAGNRGSHVRTVTVLPTTFPDVLASHWAYGFIEDLYQQRIISGYSDGSFRPENNLTRGQAAKMIAIAAGLDYEGKVADFPDVSPADEYSPYIAALAEKGAISGYLDGNFRQWDKIKRSHIAKIVALAFDLEAGPAEVSFTDLPQDPALAEYILILAGNEIVSGYDTGDFRPEKQVTRAQFSKIITLAREVAGRQSSAADSDK
jgi:GH25 family lysozyme M1 (1,4-beta-N-acetylmuramidase)